jgi:hypothetical protein
VVADADIDRAEGRDGFGANGTAGVSLRPSFAIVNISTVDLSTVDPVDWYGRLLASLVSVPGPVTAWPSSPVASFER